MSTSNDATWIDDDLIQDDESTQIISEQQLAVRRRELVEKRRRLEARLEARRIQDEFGDLYDIEEDELYGS